ncbi:MAG: type IX secretion system sortase PorU, partial [Salibacteraceae bacterium]
MKNLLLFAILFAIFPNVYSQNEEIGIFNDEPIIIQWTSPIQVQEFNLPKTNLLHFKNCGYDHGVSSLPIFEKTVYLSSNNNSAKVSITILESEELESSSLSFIDSKNLDESIQVNTTVSWYRKKPIATFAFNPIFRNSNTGKIEKIISFTYNLSQTNDRSLSATANTYKVNSVLRYGTWVKVGTTQDGIYAISYNDLNSMGISVTGLNSNSIRLFGNGGGYLPFDNSAPRIDDLEENSIEIVDGGDGTFDNGDYLLFYGQSPHRWKPSGTRFNHYTHFFSDTTYYFITTDYNIGSPKRITTLGNPSNPADVTVSTFNDFQYHENDLENFVKSGRNWYGESFSFIKNQSFSFSFPNAVRNTANIKSRMAYRVIGRSSTFTMSTNGNTIQTLSSTGVSGGYYDTYAKVKAGIDNFTLPSDNFKLDVNFSNPSSSDNGWIDYFEINCDRQLIMTGNQMSFRNLNSQTAGVIQYNISGSGFRIWNVTNPTNVYNKSLINGSIKDLGGQLNEYIAFNSSNYLSPKKFGKVANQDLHSIPYADYVIICHPTYISQANQLANYHRTYNGLTTEVVTTQQIYNEFSSGSQDITAIKTFNKMLYDRAGNDPDKMLKYVLLLGDASYDYKYRMPNNTNQVPSYQSSNSIHPLESYVTDDYFGFLDDNESDALNSTIDIGIGRIMANNNTQAQAIVDKTINYMSNPDGLRPWRNNLSFVGDDEDGNV